MPIFCGVHGTPSTDGSSSAPPPTGMDPPAGIGPVGALLNFVVAYVVSMMTQAPPRQVVELVESVRIPRGAGKATGH